MDLALAWLQEVEAQDGVILTTDADSRVSSEWVSRNVAAINRGVDAVLGRIFLDEDGALLPEALHQRGRLESEYEALLTVDGSTSKRSTPPIRTRGSSRQATTSDASMRSPSRPCRWPVTHRG